MLRRNFFIIKIPKELIRDLVREEKFESTGDILETIKGMFSDVLEEVLQCEIEEKLGYDKHERRDDEERLNYRNGSTKRKLKTQLGEIEINVPRDIDYDYKILYINRSQTRQNGKNIYTPVKTRKSNRSLLLSDNLCIYLKHLESLQGHKSEFI